VRPRAFTAHRCPDSSLLSSELGGSSAMSSAGKLSLHLSWEGAPASTATPQSHTLSLFCWSQQSLGLGLLCPSASHQHHHVRPLQKSCLLPAAWRQPRRLGTSTVHTTGTWETGSAERAPRRLACVTVQQDIEDGARGSCHTQSCP